MTELLFDEQDIVAAQYPCLWTSSSALNPLIDLSTITSNPSWTLQQNTLGLHECGGTDWTTDPFAFSSIASTSDGIDAQFFNTSLSFQSSHTDGLVPFVWQQIAPYRSSLCEAVAPTRAGENPGSLHVGTFPESSELPNLNPKPLSPGKRRSISAPSLSQSTLPRTVRHTPYVIGTRRRTTPAYVYQCRWSDGAKTCGAPLTGTKHAIGKHLQAAHGVSLKADGSHQTCLWDGCTKSMRRESIVRHVLAVHMRDKVACPMCGSRFARTDSLQRHQRTHCLADGEGSDDGKTGE